MKTLFREQNLGCGKAVAGALEWFFSQVEEGIILEDDILPEPTFFPYCAELLERYRGNDRVMMIAGYNWDHQWMFSVLDQRGICLIPCNNLVKNIGCGPDSTFAANSASYHAHRKTAPMPLPPKAPSALEPNQRTDAAILDKSNGLSRFHIFLTRLLAPVAPQIIKVLWWFSRLKSR